MNYDTISTPTSQKQIPESLDSVTDDAAKQIANTQASKAVGASLVIEGIFCKYHFGPGIWPYLGLGGVAEAAHEKVVHTAAHMPELFGYGHSHSFGHDIVELGGIVALAGIVGAMTNKYEKQKSKLEDEANNYISKNPNATKQEIQSYLKGDNTPIMKKIQNPGTYLYKAIRRAGRKRRRAADFIRNPVNYIMQANNND